MKRSDPPLTLSLGELWLWWLPSCFPVTVETTNNRTTNYFGVYKNTHFNPYRVISLTHQRSTVPKNFISLPFLLPINLYPSCRRYHSISQIVVFIPLSITQNYPFPNVVMCINYALELILMEEKFFYRKETPRWWQWWWCWWWWIRMCKYRALEERTNEERKKNYINKSTYKQLFALWLHRKFSPNFQYVHIVRGFRKHDKSILGMVIVNWAGHHFVSVNIVSLWL